MERKNNTDFLAPFIPVENKMLDPNVQDSNTGGWQTYDGAVVKTVD
jgi:hypothetical protein